jgi:hypothetical protein
MGGVHVGFWWEIQKERDHYEYLDIRGRIILKWIRMGWKQDGKIGTSGGLL